MTKVFISSTSEDLKAYRQVANEECNRLGLVPIDMQYFPATGKGATEGSYRKLDAADLYVGIFAHRYGYIEEGFEHSVTEMEYAYAGKERNLDRLCFLVHPEYDWPESGVDIENQKRLRSFKAKVEKDVIRNLFKSVEDFQGKLRLALIDWKLRTPESGSVEPPLSLNLLNPNKANRFTYCARQTSFVGRTHELAVLGDFISSGPAFSWLVVSGPGGSGKSRLVQEFCMDCAPHWRAGFLPRVHNFDAWTNWKPTKNTLIIIDYAAERVDEAENILKGLMQNQNAIDSKMYVRVILVEREGEGTWLEALMGNRSERYVLEQVRYSRSPILLPPLAEEDLWAGISSMHQNQSPSVSLPSREQLMADLRVIDPLCRPLYAILATDALISGRNIRHWDRERLMQDVLRREHQGWSKAGVTKQYENLIALATMAGGLTEAVLEQPDIDVDLPSFESFDRSIYNAMSGCDPKGEDIPPLKPDLLGEFFVLNQIKGRNERLTTQNAAKLCKAAWKICGGSRQRDYFGLEAIKHVSPSNLILFLHRLISDYSDHPAALLFLDWPEGQDVDRYYWGDLIVVSICHYLSSGDLKTAEKLFGLISSLDPSELAMVNAEDELIKATFSMLSSKEWIESQENLDSIFQRVRERAFAQYSSFSIRLAYCEGSANAIGALLAIGKEVILNQLLEDQYTLVQKNPEQNELQVQYAKSLSILVCTEDNLEFREEYLERLRTFCKQFSNNVILYAELAKAAEALINIYLDSGRLEDAERMNRFIRGLLRSRQERHIVQTPTSYEDIIDLKFEVFENDIVILEYTLARSDLWLIDPFVLAKRYRDADYLLMEIKRTWLHHPENSDFAVFWGFAIMKHADGCAKMGDFEMIPKAVDELGELAIKYPDHQSIQGFSSRIVTFGLKRAIEQSDFLIAEEMFAKVEELAVTPQASQEAIANYADSALEFCSAYQKKQEVEKSMKAVQKAIWALRSEAFKQAMLARGPESSIDTLYEWLDKVETWPE